jgi:Flp pilus assembly protein TadG
MTEHLPRSVFRNLKERIERFLSDRDGVSAVEFAMLLPLMLTLYLGTIEVGQGVSIDRKVTITARTLADLVSQATSVNNAEMTNIFAASAAVMTPYPVNVLQARVSAVNINGAGIATVGWSDGNNMAARAVGSTVAMPAALAVPNTQLLWSEITYTYTPSIGYVVIGSLNMTEQSYVRPRQSSVVARVP